jgi:hypothetical protein
MATLAVLPLAATGTLGAVGAPLALGAATLIDRLYTFPAIFGEDQARPERYGQLDLGTADVGSPRNWAWGRYVAVAAHLMWMSQPDRQQTTQSKGGKQGVSQFDVNVDFALAFNDVWSKKLLRIWANGRKWYSEGSYHNGVSEHRIVATSQTTSLLLQATSSASIDFSMAFTPDQVVVLVNWSPVGLNDLWVVDSVSAANSVGVSEMVLLPINSQSVVSGTAGTQTHPARINAPTIVANHNGNWRWSEVLPTWIELAGMDDSSLFNVDDEVYLGNDTDLAGRWRVLWSNKPHGYGQPERLVMQALDSQSWTPGLTLQTLDSGNPSAYLELRARPSPYSPASTEPSTVAFYNGGDLQTADSEIVADKTDVPGYRGRCYQRFSDVNLNAFGNQVPTARVLLERGPDDRLWTVMSEIMHRHGFDVGQYEIEGAWNIPLLGYNVRGPLTGIEALQPLMVHYDFLMQERGAVLAMFPREDADVIQVRQYATNTNRTVKDLGARDENEQAMQPVEVRNVDNVKIPTRVEVSFTDPLNDYQPGTEGYGQRNPAGADRDKDVAAIDLGSLTLWRWDVKNRATEMLYQAALNARQVTLTLPPSYIHLLENDRLAFTEPTTGEAYAVLVQRVRRGANFQIHVEGVVDTTEKVAGSTSSGGDPLNQWPGASASALAAHALDIAPIRNLDIWEPSLYLVATARGPWGGVTVWESFDDSNYYHIATLSNEGTTGEAATKLEVHEAGVWDYTNTVKIALDDESVLVNNSQANVLGWRNIALLGDEIIGFSEASQNTDGTWTLSTLYRGIRDTADATDAHAVGERFVLLFDHRGDVFTRTGAVVHTLDRPVAAQTRYYKFVPAGLGLNDVDSQSVVIQGWNARPFTPSNLQASRDGSNNATLTWDRETRAIGATLTTQLNKAVEEHEEYDVEITNATPTRVFQIRTSTWGVRDALRQVIYLASEQTADGITPGDPLNVEVYQVGTHGRSQALAATV